MYTACETMAEIETYNDMQFNRSSDGVDILDKDPDTKKSVLCPHGLHSPVIAFTTSQSNVAQH